MLEEKELVGRILAGDQDAANDFVKIFRPRLVRASLYFLGYHDSDAEDIVQDAFMIAFPKLHHYDFCAPIYAWLRQICLRLCYARMRRRGRVSMALQEEMEVHMQRKAMDRVQAEGLEAQKQLRLAVLHELKKSLGPDSREIIELRNVRGLSYAQISLSLGIPIGTVMSRLARAREQLRKLLDAMPKDETVQVQLA